MEVYSPAERVVGMQTRGMVAGVQEEGGEDWRDDMVAMEKEERLAKRRVTILRPSV